MNGFGFVQLVSRLERPSLVARFARRPAAAAARRSAALCGAGGRTGHAAAERSPCRAPRDAAAIGEAELARRTGRLLRWQEVAELALHAAFAQAVSRMGTSPERLPSAAARSAASRAIRLSARSAPRAAVTAISSTGWRKAIPSPARC